MTNRRRSRPGPIFDEGHCRRACERIARDIVRPLVREHFRPDAVRVEVKRDQSVATAADSAIERAIRAYLEREFPGYGVLGEELGASGLQSPLVWSIDPIDGTEAFVAGLPFFGTLLAVIRQSAGARVPIFGALYLPVQDELVMGSRKGTTRNGETLVLNEASRLPRTQLLVGDLSAIARRVDAACQDRLLALMRRFRSTQTWGDCLGYRHLLAGKAHARIDADLGVDDIAPLEPIMLGAGGSVSGWRGESVTELISGLPDLAAPASFDIVVAASRELHAEVLAALSP